MCKAGPAWFDHLRRSQLENRLTRAKVRKTQLRLISASNPGCILTLPRLVGTARCAVPDRVQRAEPNAS